MGTLRTQIETGRPHQGLGKQAEDRRLGQVTACEEKKELNENFEFGSPVYVPCHIAPFSFCKFDFANSNRKCNSLCG